MYLVGDIGGTKTHLALYEKNKLIKEEIFPSRHFKSFDEILEKFLDRPVQKGCLAIAGPVRNQKVHITNLGWEIDADRLKIPNVHLLNDLEATAWGLKGLKSDELVTLNPGVKQNGNKAVVAAGTGLGVAAIAEKPFATEGGHADFAPRDAKEIEFWNYLHKKYGHVSIERVVSGQGVEHLYWFLVEKHKSKQILEGEEIPRLVIESAKTSPLCQEVLQWFASLYGAAAGNAALHYLAVGGVYLAGGIAPKILTYLKQGEFIRAFCDKGRLSDLMAQIPVHVVLNEKLPLLGALEYCTRDS